jgi:hypothetical protein
MMQHDMQSMFKGKFRSLTVQGFPDFKEPFGGDNPFAQMDKIMSQMRKEMAMPMSFGQGSG